MTIKIKPEFSTSTIAGRCFIHREVGRGARRLIGWLDREGIWQRNRTGLVFTKWTGRWKVTMPGQTELETVGSIAEGLLMVSRIEEFCS